MSEVNPEAGGTTPEATPTPAPEPAPAPTLTPEMVDAWLKENNFTAFRADSPELAKLNAPDPAPAPAQSLPNVPDYDPWDPNSVARIVQDQTKELPGKVAEDVTKKVMETLNPILNSFAQTQVMGGARPEAKPFVEQVMKEFNVTPFQLAQDPKTAQLVNDAAELRALKAGKIAPNILFPSDPPGGATQVPSMGDDVRTMLAQSEAFVGRPLTEAEQKAFMADFEAAKKKEGIGV